VWLSQVSSPGWVGAGVLGEDVGVAVVVGALVGASEEHSMTISNVPERMKAAPSTTQVMSSLPGTSCTISEEGVASMSLSSLPSES